MPVEWASLVLTGLLAGGAPAAPAGDSADAEMLEFIGSFEGKDGKWVDPQTLEDKPAVAPASPCTKKPCQEP